jgi:hypothetical protein
MKEIISRNILLKSLILTSFTFIILFNTQCSSGNEGGYLGLKPSGVNSSNNSINQQANNDKIEVDDQERIRNAENTIKNVSSDFNLTTLKEKTLQKNETELRIWAELGMDIVNCLILQKKNNSWSASLISANVKNGGFEKNSDGKVTFKTKVSLLPKSGWNSLDEYLIQKSIRSPLPYSLDTKKNPLTTDNGINILEIKQSDNYSLVFYRDLTESQDGKTFMDVCNYLENEFDVKIGCRD